MNRNQIERKLKRQLLMLERLGDYSAETHTYHGGWSVGYVQGKVSVLDDLLDELGFPTKDLVKSTDNYGTFTNINNKQGKKL